MTKSSNPAETLCGCQRWPSPFPLKCNKMWCQIWLLCPVHPGPRSSPCTSTTVCCCGLASVFRGSFDPICCCGLRPKKVSHWTWFNQQIHVDSWLTISLNYSTEIQHDSINSESDSAALPWSTCWAIAWSPLVTRKPLPRVTPDGPHSNPVSDPCSHWDELGEEKRCSPPQLWPSAAHLSVQGNLLKLVYKLI